MSTLQVLKDWRWLASNVLQKLSVCVAQGPYIHWSTVKHISSWKLL